MKNFISVNLKKASVYKRYMVPYSGFSDQKEFYNHVLQSVLSTQKFNFRSNHINRNSSFKTWYIKQDSVYCDKLISSFDI